MNFQSDPLVWYESRNESLDHVVYRLHVQIYSLARREHRFGASFQALRRYAREKIVCWKFLFSTYGNSSIFYFIRMLLRRTEKDCKHKEKIQYTVCTRTYSALFVKCTSTRTTTLPFSPISSISCFFYIIFSSSIRFRFSCPLGK